MNKTKGLIFTASLVLATTLTLSCEDKEKDKPATAAETASVAETAAPPTEAAEAPNIPDPEEGAFTDSRDGKKYKSLKIGEQVWMAENLNYKTKGGKCFGEGGKFTQEYYEDYPEEKTLSKAEVQANCTKYGRLYNWETAKKSCPKDWHLPSKEEWATLVNFVGGEKRIKKGNKYSFSSDAPCCGEADGRFVGESVSGGNWWSSSEPKGDGKNAYGWYIGYGMNYGLLYDIADSIYKDKSSLLYVRCVEDSEEYRAEAAAKNKALEDLIVKVIKANSNEDELNKLIIKDFGIAYFYAPGIMSYIYRFDKISYKDRESEYGPPYGLYCETDNYKIRFEKPRYSGCHDDDAKWNKPPGIYCDTTQTSDRLASTAKRTNELMGEKVWSAKQIKKFEEIEKENHEVIVIDKDGGACIFYVAFWQNKWYLIAIDQFDPCSA